MELISYMVWNGSLKTEEPLRKMRHLSRRIHFYPMQFWWKEMYLNASVKTRKRFTLAFPFPLSWKKIWNQYRSIQMEGLRLMEMFIFMWCSISTSLIVRNWSEYWKKFKKISMLYRKQRAIKNRIWIFTADIKHVLHSRHSAVKDTKRQKNSLLNKKKKNSR